MTSTGVLDSMGMESYFGSDAPSSGRTWVFLLRAATKGAVFNKYVIVSYLESTAPFGRGSQQKLRARAAF
jgi:hypothetical protein